MKHGELFAGYGGLGLAIEAVFGADLAWYAEHDAAPSRIMARHWPDAPNHGDVTTVDWEGVEPVDIISGGSPCQDVSAAGRRAGMIEGTRSNLWVAMREAIATIKPTYVVWENVRGAHSAGAYSAVESEPGLLGERRAAYLRATGRVVGDLAQLGYDAQWRTLSAASVGAPHRRERVFVIAWRRDADLDHPESFGRREGWPEPAGQRPDLRTAVQLLPTPVCTDANGTRNATANRRPGAQFNSGMTLTDAIDLPGWGKYAPAISRWEQATNRHAPPPTELSPRGKHRLSECFTEWMMGLPAGWICDTDGLTRNDKIKAAGNGVVPQQAAAALADMSSSIPQPRKEHPMTPTPENSQALADTAAYAEELKQADVTGEMLVAAGCGFARGRMVYAWQVEVAARYLYAKDYHAGVRREGEPLAEEYRERVRSAFLAAGFTVLDPPP